MKFDDLRKLHQKKYRDELRHFLVEGAHPVLELQKAAARDPRLRAAKLFVTAEHQHWQSAFEIEVIGSRQMAQLSDTKTPQGIIAVVPIPQPLPPLAQQRAVYLYEVQDPGNLGTILRTLAWFGNLRCLLSPGSVDPYNSKVVRASAGAIFHVPLELDVEPAELSARYARIACLDMQGDPLPAPDFAACTCYVFGNEARGLPREQLTAFNGRSFRIAGSGAGESLNLAAAVNIAVYEMNRSG